MQPSRPLVYIDRAGWRKSGPRGPRETYIRVVACASSRRTCGPSPVSSVSFARGTGGLSVLLVAVNREPSERVVAVIGLGRVGLPLALSFADRGLRVLGVDHDRARLDSIRAAKMPFEESGTQELLERVAVTGRLEFADRAADAARPHDIVLTLGTPSSSHVESDLSQIRPAVDDLLPLLRPGHALILRSTIAPGTTDFVAGYLEKSRGLRAGVEVFVAHAPERIAAGKLLQGIKTLTCVFGWTGRSSTQ